jgi:hypothetical protein
MWKERDCAIENPATTIRVSVMASIAAFLPWVSGMTTVNWPGGRLKPGHQAPMRGAENASEIGLPNGTGLSYRFAWVIRS